MPLTGEDLHRRRRQDVRELVRNLGARQPELLVGLLVHEVRLAAVVVEELDVLRLGVDARELLAGAERVVDTAPVSRFLSFVRTNAPPLPGFTCWKSMIRHIAPRCSMCIPVLNWFVETMSAMTRGRVAARRRGASMARWLPGAQRSTSRRPQDRDPRPGSRRLGARASSRRCGGSGSSSSIRSPPWRRRRSSCSGAGSAPSTAASSTGCCGRSGRSSSGTPSSGRSSRCRWSAA